MSTTQVHLVKGLILILAGAVLLIGCPKPRQVTLPIYRLATPTVSEETVQQLGGTILGISGQVSRQEDRLVLQSDDKIVEVYAQTGAVWVADEGRVWNVDLEPTVPDSAMAVAMADEFLQKNDLLPSPGPRELFEVSLTSVGGTFVAVFDGTTRTRRERQLDVQVNYAVRMRVPIEADTARSVAVVGGGGEFNLTLGNEGAVIGFSGLWRPIASVETESALIPREQADRQFRELVGGMEIHSFESFLAYYSAPPSVEQRFLYPVYVYRASAVVEGELVPLRLITLPATEFGPQLEIPVPARERSERDMPPSHSTLPEGLEERGTPPGSASNGNGSFMTPMPQASWREAGTSWIGTSGGLTGSQSNAQGFVDGLSADGWSVNFNWGDAAAWESDWRRNDDGWVDAADFVFYTGHADMNGWVLRSPDDGSLRRTEVGANPEAPGDLWGQQDLEWVIIAACGPLQDEILSPGGGDVFDRWAGAFDGLHQLLGYAAVTYDNTEEGKTIVKYAREGKSIISAWFRTAREIQPSTNGYGAPNGPTIWVGVMYVYRSGTTSPYNDHIWLHGSVASDPVSPNVYVAMWTTT